MEVPEIRLLKERCVLCGDCLLLCPQSRGDVREPVFEMSADGSSLTVRNREACIACFTCVEFCRARAIQVTSLDASHEDHPDVFPTRPPGKMI